MPRQLNIRSDEAYELATKIARRTGRTRADVVLAALLSYQEAKTGKKLTRTQRAFVDELMALAHRSASAAGPEASSDHSHFYDEHGLPK